MRARLPKHVFKKLMNTINDDVDLDPAVADAVAVAMKDWAVAKGAHTLHPLVPAAHGADRREARLLRVGEPGRARDRRIQWGRSDSG